MNETMFESKNPQLGQDQTLALQSQLMEYIRDALVYDKGYMVFSIKDLSTFEFTNYYSDGNNIDVMYEETRDETIERILYVIDCADLTYARGNGELISDILKYLFNYVVGIISANLLHEKYNIKDFSHIFE